jgi:ubiquinone/menaquinone biosynthesis C-methylase UbiE
LPSDSVDVAYSISTIEHIPKDELPGMMREIERVLKPGGHGVFTVDLFLNLRPFTNRDHNEFGINVAPAELIAASGMSLVSGERAELLGFPEFDPQEVLARLERYLIGDRYPCMAQCFTLRKRA